MTLKELFGIDVTAGSAKISYMAPPFPAKGSVA
jgi:hypothetical protein